MNENGKRTKKSGGVKLPKATGDAMVKKSAGAKKTAKRPPTKKKTITIEVDGPYVLLKWKPYLDMYEDIRALEFETKEDRMEAFRLLHGPDLRECPFDMAFSRGHGAIFVPADAVPYFKKLKFKEYPVSDGSDMTPEDMKERPTLF